MTVWLWLAPLLLIVVPPSILAAITYIYYRRSKPTEPPRIAHINEDIELQILSGDSSVPRPVIEWAANDPDAIEAC